MENKNEKIYKTTQEYRNKVKSYEDKIRNDPIKYKKRIDYHKQYYRIMKEALAKMKSNELTQNTQLNIVE